MKELTISQIQKYRGVSGWLLLFCINLTILSPLLVFSSLNETYEKLKPLFNQLPGVKVIFLITLVLEIIKIAFSIRAGHGLWTIKPKAVKTAKNFMIIYLAISTFELSLPFMGAIPTKYFDGMVLQMINNKDAWLPFLSFGVWYSYLCVSKRVIATYLTPSVVIDMVIDEKEDDKVSKPIVIFFGILMTIIIVLATYAIIKN